MASRSRFSAPPAAVRPWLLLLFAALLLPTTARAQEDTDPPVLSGTPTLAPDAIDVAAGEQSVTLSLPLQDASGVASVSAFFYQDGFEEFEAARPGSRPVAAAGSPGDCTTTLASGSAADGVWEAVCTFGPNTMNGEWTPSVYAVDGAGNGTDLPTGLTLAVTGGDGEPPVRTGLLTVDPAALDLSAGETTLTLTIPLQDASGVAGLQSAALWREASFDYIALTCTPLTLLSGDAFDGTWQTECTVPDDLENGSYEILLSPEDSLGNVGYDETGQFVDITGSAVDNQAPVLSGTPTIDPAAVDVSGGDQTVVLTLPLQDVSGISFVSVTFGRSGSGSFSSCSETLVSGTTTDGVWEAVCTIAATTAPGDWSVSVYASDTAGNAASLPTGLTLTVTGGDSEPPVLAGPVTVSPTTLDLSASETTLTLTLPLQDASGVARLRSTYLATTGSFRSISCAPLTLLSGDAFDGTWQTECTVSTDLPEDTYEVAVSPEDSLGNQSLYYTGQFVTLTGSDQAPPALAGTPTLTPPVADLSGGAVVVTMTAHLTDATGVDRVTMRLRDDEGNTVYTPAAALLTGDATDGTWQATLTLPPRTADMDLTLHIWARDANGYDAEFDTGLTLSVTGGDVVAPVLAAPPVVDETASPTERIVTLAVRDEGSGVQSVRPWLKDEDGTSSPLVFAARVAGTAHDGTWQAVLDVARLDNGEARLFVTLTDSVGNSLSNHDTGITTYVDGPPDLIVADLQPGDDPRSGGTLAVTWTVENTGAGPTTAPEWIDYVWLSTDLDLRRGDDIQLSTVSNLYPLDAGESYVRSVEVELPEDAVGTYYLFVSTDNDDAFISTSGRRVSHDRGSVVEALEDNNFAYVAIDIALTPPPDLQVTGLTVPPAVFSGQPVPVSWTVTNEGEGTVERASWKDHLYLSEDEVLDDDDLFLRFVTPPFNQALQLLPGEGYDTTATVTFPIDTDGTYHVLVVTDPDDVVFEYTFDDNNVRASDPITVTLAPPPDLTVSAVEPQGEARSGQPLRVRWTVDNAGGGDVRARSWYDEIWLSADAVLDRDTATRLRQIVRYTPFRAGESYSDSIDVTVPEGLEGTHYLHVVTDATERVFEYDRETNNTTSVPLTVSLTPAPDLTVADVTAPAEGQAGDVVLVSWSVLNQSALGTAQGTWTDRVYLGTSAAGDTTGAYLLGSTAVAGPLAPGQTYRRELGVRLPVDLAGPFHLIVVADASDDVYEHGAEGNNAGVAAEAHPPITVVAYPPVDLAVTAFEAPATALDGTTIPVTVTLTNRGLASPRATAWVDALYLSADTTFDADADVLLAEADAAPPLDAGATYTWARDVAVPVGTRGDLYLLAVADRDGAMVLDTTRANNLRAVPLAVALAPAADLTVPALTVPDEALAGTRISVSWTVRNDGDTLAAGPWTDAVWLSKSARPNNSATLVATITREADLEADSSYTVTADVTLPGHLSGAYYLIVETNRSEDVFERPGHAANTAAHLMNLTLAPPADLVVEQLTVPATGTAGMTAPISWTLANRGTHPATGSVRQAVYLSADPVWDLDDPLLGLVEQEVDLLPGTSASMQLAARPLRVYAAEADGTITEPLPGLPPGDYYVLVRANLLESIRETDYDNNSLASDATLALGIPDLTPGTDVLLDSTGMAYYRLPVPAGVDVAVSLDQAGTAGGAAELYVRRGTLASRSTYDAYAAGFGPERRVVLPAQPAADTVYVLAYLPEYTGPQHLRADLLGFDVTRVTPAYGGTAGVVTVLVEGAQFSEATEILLRSPEGDEMAPFELYPVHSALMRARFDLRGSVPGFYDVVARTAGQEAVLAGGFDVREGGSARPRVYLSYPDAFRPFEPLTVHVTLINEGEINALDYMLTVFAPPDIAIEPQQPDALLPELPGRPPLTFGEDAGPFYFQTTGANILPIQVFELPPGDRVDLVLDLVGDRRIGETVFFNAKVTRLTRSRFTDTGRMADIRSAAGFKHMVNLLTLAIEQNDLAAAGKASGECDTKADVEGLVAEFLSAAGLTPGSALKNMATTIAGLIASELGGPLGVAAALLAEIYSAYNYVTGLESAYGKLWEEIDKEMKRAQKCREEEEEETPPPPPPSGNPPGWTCGASGCSRTPPNDEDDDDGASTPTGSRDPNDLLGPAGYGAERWVGLGAPLPYTIRFENDSTFANGPAQRVTIEQALDPDFDAGSFRLGGFGFAGHTFTVPPGRAFYSTRVDVRDTLGVFVDVMAGLDVVRNRLTWTFQAIDPATGQPPRDPRVGMLPVNDTAGAGQGYVTYTIEPNPASPTGARLDAVADIVFDQNEVIRTPPIFNTLDAAPPASRIVEAPAGLSDVSATVRWTGDDGEGAGIATYTLYVAADGGPFEPVQTDLTGTETAFTGEIGTTYEFFVLATDHAGNREALKTARETYALVGATTTVRPGDTNTDGAVDEQDLLPIGAHFGTYGPSRLGTAADWAAQEVLVWTPEAAAAADANGDGVVDEGDVLVVGTHFGNTDAAGKGAAEGMARLQIQPLPVGKTFPIHLSAGTDDAAVEVLGASLRLRLPPELAYAGADPGAALVADGADALRLVRAGDGLVAAAFTRRAVQGGSAPLAGEPVVTVQVEVVAPMASFVDVVLERAAALTAAGVALDPSALRLASPEAVEVPTQLRLEPNYPNPFNPTTTIRFALPEAGPVSLEVYDVLGRRVARLLDRDPREAGWHAVRFDATGLASGIYFYRVEIGRQRQVRKMLLVK